VRGHFGQITEAGDEGERTLGDAAKWSTRNQNIPGRFLARNL